MESLNEKLRPILEKFQKEDERHRDAMDALRAEQERVKILKVFPGNMVDMQAVNAPYDFMPNYKPVFYSIQLNNYKIVEE